MSEVESQIEETGVKSEQTFECRACLQILNEDCVLHNIFEGWTPPWDGMENSIAEDLAKIANVQISESDRHSKIICETCCQLLLSACSFTAIVKRNDEILQQRYREDKTQLNFSKDRVWPKPIQVDKSIDSSMYKNVDIKEEIVSDDEQYPSANGSYDASRDDLPNLDIVKIEPEEIIQQQPSQLHVAVNGNEELEHLDTKESHLTNGNSDSEEYLLSEVKEEPVSDEDDSDQAHSDLSLDCMLCAKAFNSVSGLKTGRNKTTVRKRGAHTEDAMRKAMELVKSGMSIRKASEECQLKYATVRLYVNKMKANPETRLTPNYEVNKIFTSEQEKEIADYIEYCAQLFYGLTTKDCRRIVYQMAIANNIKIPQSWIDSEMAGLEWLRSFRKRHPEISLSKLTEPFFSKLKSVMERHPSFADGTRMYNLDETLTTTVDRQEKILARKGTNTEKITNGERDILVTTCCIVSATGQALPPAMVFRRETFEPHLINGAPPGTLGLIAASGSMNAQIFVDVMKHFNTHVSASKENPALLIMDKHESHLSIKALDLAKSSGVTVLTLPPHSNAKVQPLDVLKGPLQSYYDAAVDLWLLRHPGQPLTIYNVAENVGYAYMKSMTPINIVNAFKETRIFPFDDCNFAEVDFMPSTVTDRPQIEQEVDHHQREKSSTSPSPLENLDSKSRDNDIKAPIIEVPDLLATLSASDDVDLKPDLARNRDESTPPMIKALDLPTSSRVHREVGNQDITPRIMEAAGPSKLMSPKKFMLPIKAKPRELKKRRVPSKNIIATDTPENNVIAFKKIKVIKKMN